MANKDKDKEGKCRDCGKSVLDSDLGLQCEVCNMW